MTYEQAVKELYYSIFGSNPTNYHAVLYHLIGKADLQNKALLRLAYPMEVRAWEEWQESESEAEFFGRFRFPGAPKVGAPVAQRGENAESDGKVGPHWQGLEGLSGKDS